MHDETQSKKSILSVVSVLPKLLISIYSQGVLIAVLVYLDVISSLFKIDDDKTVNVIASKMQVCKKYFNSDLVYWYNFYITNRDSTQNKVNK